MKIFIDAGHNPKGKDTGAEGFGLKEQDVAFHIAKKLSELLDGAGADTKLSRPSITDVVSLDLNTSLNARAAMANAVNAAIPLRYLRQTAPSAMFMTNRVPFTVWRAKLQNPFAKVWAQRIAAQRFQRG